MTRPLAEQRRIVARLEELLPMLVPVRVVDELAEMEKELSTLSL